MTPDVERIRYVTGHFRALQGFRTVPLGLFVFFLTQGGQAWPAVAQLGSVAVLAGLWALIDAYYRHAFGRVERLPTAGREVLFWVIGGLAFVGAVVAEQAWQPPVSPTLLVLGVLLAYPWLLDRVRPYHALFGGLVALFGLLPLLPGVTREAPWWAFDGPAMGLLFGGGIILTGVLDHLLLVRTLPPAPAEGDVAHG